MNTPRLALAYLAQRPLLTALHVALLALGVATVVFLVLFTSQAGERLARDARGIDLVVGAKGSPLQIILSGIYHADVPTGNIALKDVEALSRNRLVASVTPLALGDSYRGLRIVGTDASFLKLYDARLAQGVAATDEMEAVLGSEAARRTGLALGSTFVGAHGLAEAATTAHESHPFRVVGILAPTGTVADRLILTPVESIWHVHEGHAGTGEREVTAALIRYSTPLAAAMLPRQVNAGTALQAASPAYESARLFNLLGAGVETLRLFAVVLMAAAALSVFTALTSALEDRRYDLALLRTLGASPARLLALLAFEGMALTGAGLAAGFVLGHGAAQALGAYLARTNQWPITGWTWAGEEIWIAVAVLAAGALTSAIPAWRAYHSDPALMLLKH